MSFAHVPIQGVTANSIYSIEIWGLTSAEAADFKNWTPGNKDATKDKDKKRQYQFILKQGALGNLPTVNIGGEDYLGHSISIDFQSLIDASNTNWYPQRNQQRCETKLINWLNQGTAGKCDTDAHRDATWKSFKFKSFYDFIKAQKDSRSFYIVVENSIDGKSNWTDSKLIPLQIGQAPPAVTGKCKTIVECKALIDKKFVQIFR